MPEKTFKVLLRKKDLLKVFEGQNILCGSSNEGRPFIGLKLNDVLHKAFRCSLLTEDLLRVFYGQRAF